VQEQWVRAGGTAATPEIEPWKAVSGGVLVAAGIVLLAVAFAAEKGGAGALGAEFGLARWVGALALASGLLLLVGDVVRARKGQRAVWIAALACIGGVVLVAALPASIEGVAGLAFAMAMVVWGWKLYRLIVALISGLSAAVLGGGVVIAALADRGGGGWQSTLLTGLLVATLGLVVGLVVGFLLAWIFQQVAAGAFAFVSVAAFTFVVVWAVSMSASETHSGSAGLAAMAAVLAGAVALVVALKFYDYFAASLTALLVASGFNTFREAGLLDRLAAVFGNPQLDPAIRQVDQAIRILVGELASPIWSRLTVAVFVVASALWFRRFAWSRAGEATAWSLRPQWLRAVVASGSVVLAGTAVETAFDWPQGSVAGIYPIIWP
jgi:hypothetical protein